MAFVTDTHALVWHLTDDSRLPKKVKKIFEDEQIFIPCIIFFELTYLIDKKKIPANLDVLISLISSSQNYRVEPLCIPVIQSSREISKKVVGDPWDRIIAATSIYLNLPLITKDRKLRTIGIKTVW